jgi:V/A-type H+-transporting ATPase subunit C
MFYYSVEFKPDIRYAYHTGRVRALETKLLNPSQIENMLTASSINDTLLYLEDTAYDETIGELRKSEDYEICVNKEKEAALDLSEKLIIDKEVKKLLRITYDFLNIKAMLKGRFTEKDTFGMLSEFGTIPAEELNQSFQSENFSHLPEFSREVIGEAMAYYHMEKSLKSIEFLIDRYEFKYLLSLVRKTKNPFLVEYIKMNIDLINISTLLRIIYFKSGDELEEILIEDGNLSTSFLLDLKGESLDSLPSFFRNTPYTSCIQKGIKKINKDGSFTVFDRERDNHLINYIKLARNVTFGVEPVFSYFMARKYDLNNIKMILVGKMYDIPVEKIRERLTITFN